MNVKNVLLIILVIVVTKCRSQEEEVDTLFAATPPPILSFGISGGVAFINPTAINDQIQFNNSAFNTNEPPIRTPGQFAVWLTFRPPNIESVISLRGEMMISTRRFTFTTRETDPSGAPGNPLSGTAISRYSLYPFSISSGTVIPKTRVKMEVGFVYAFAIFDDEVTTGSFGEQKRTYEGQGYGFRVGLQQVMPMWEKIGLSIDFAYRYLKLDEFRDSRGSTLNSMEVSYNGVSFMMGLAYGF